jgi:hypothetical protein
MSSPADLRPPRPGKGIVERLHESEARAEAERRRPPRIVGARRPDETGMLPMIPLAPEGDHAPADANATAFFAIPGPRRPDSPRPVELLRTPGEPPPPPRVVPLRSIPRPPEPPAVSRLSHPEPTTVPGRVESTRIVALLLLVFALACAAALAAAAVALRPALQAPASLGESPVVHLPAPRRPATDRDTGGSRLVDPPRPSPAPPGGEGGPPHRSAGPGTSATRTLTVSFVGSVTPLQVEVDCVGGPRLRATVRGDMATVPNIPTGGTCRLLPKGGVVATAAPIDGGGAYTCAILGTTTSCHH